MCNIANLICFFSFNESCISCFIYNASQVQQFYNYTVFHKNEDWRNIIIEHQLVEITLKSCKKELIFYFTIHTLEYGIQVQFKYAQLNESATNLVANCQRKWDGDIAVDGSWKHSRINDVTWDSLRQKEKDEEGCFAHTFRVW